MRERLLAVLLTAVAALAGCGDGDTRDGSDAGADSDADTDTDTDADADGGADGSTDADTDADTDTGYDTEPITGCPDAWYDAEHGRSWQAAQMADKMSWSEAGTACDGLTLCEHDDWRLPSVDDLRSLIRGCDATMAGGSCGVTDECLDLDCWVAEECQFCTLGAGPAEGGCYWPDEAQGVCTDGYNHWTASARPDDATKAWSVYFGTGGIGSVDATWTIYVRCVHGGA